MDVGIKMPQFIWEYKLEMDENIVPCYLKYHSR